MAYQHGAYGSEVATSLLSPTEIDSGLIVAFGTAPVHLAKNPAKANKPVLCYQYSEYVEQFGYTGDFDKYTLDEVAQSQFVLFKMAPTVFVNVLNPDKHFNEVEKTFGGVSENPVKIEGDVPVESLKVVSEGVETVTLEGGIDYFVDTDTDTQVTTIDVIVGVPFPSDTITISYTDGTDTVSTDCAVADLPYTLPAGATDLLVTAEQPFTNTLDVDVDYTAAYNSDGEVIFTILDATKIVNDTVKISWHELDPSQVTEADIIGGIDLVTGDATGLELIEEVYPRFGLVPGTIIAPKFSQSPTVAAVMKAKCTNINDIFRAIALVDIPSDEIINYTNAPEYKNQKNLVDTSLVACYPKVALGGKQYNLSTQLASLMNKTDSEHDNIPYKSPSNENLQCDSSVLADGTEKYLSLPQANYLNGQGIVTALNFVGGWKAWGNRTTAYPSNTDVKDNFIPIRRMFNWINNTLVTMFWSKIDDPLNRRLIESVIDSANIWFNGLTAKGAILGGRVELLGTDNTTTDLMDGKINFHVYYTPPSPARKIEFIQEYDPSYIADLLS